MRQRLEAAERDLLDALQRRDGVRVDRMLSDEFLITTAGWIAEPADKQTWLGALDQHTLDAYTFRLLAARSRGEVWVALAETDQQGTHNSESWSLRFRYTDVWVAEDGVLKLLVRHASAASSQ